MATTELAGGFVRRDDGDGIITVTFTRADKLNAVTASMIHALAEAAEDLATDPTNKVLVITGEGRYFTAGMDLAELGRAPDPDTDYRTSLFRHAMRDGLHNVFDELEAIEKPIVVASQGHSMGFGVEMALSCDYHLAAAGVRFSLPELTHTGFLPGSGGLSRLARLVGPHWAKWLLVGMAVTADEARHIGLVHAVHPADDFADHVREFARHLATLPSEAFGLGKLAIDAAVNADRRTARDIDRLVQSLVVTSDEFAARQEAMGAEST